MKKYSSEQKNYCLEAIKNGTPLKDVAKSTGIPASTIGTWRRKKQQLPEPPQPSLLNDLEHQKDADRKPDDSTETDPLESERLPIGNGYFVTNHLNLAYILAAGLIMEPKGFGSKYYGDVLQQFPGWVSIFPGPVPAGALAQANAERPNLRPCLVEIAVEQIEGPCTILQRDGQHVDGAIPGQLNRSDTAVLLRTPLPVSLFKRIVFRNEADREAFEERADLAANVDTARIACEVDGLIFETADVPWPPSESRAEAPDPVREDHAATPNAIGGILALLYHTANRSDLAADAYASASNEEGSLPAMPGRDPILRHLPLWLRRVLPTADTDVRTAAFWEFIDAVGQHQSGAPRTEFVDFALAFFNEKAALGGNAAAEWTHLTTVLRKSAGLGEGSISELLEVAGAPITRAVVLASLRNRAEEFMQLLDSLGTQYLQDNDEVLVLASILFGARSGWMKLPRMMRRPHSLAAFVEQRMAVVAQGSSGLLFTTNHRAPRPLRTLFWPWQAERKKVALQLCERLGWDDCVATRIELAGRERLRDETDYLVIAGGSPLTEKIVVRIPRFLSKLGVWPPIDEESEKEIRAQLEEA